MICRKFRQRHSLEVQHISFPSVLHSEAFVGGFIDFEIQERSVFLCFTFQI